MKYAPRTRIIEAREAALDPEHLPGFFVARANAGDVEGLVALYEPDTVLAGPEGRTLGGTEAIRSFYAALLADRPRFEPREQMPALLRGDLALTSSRLTDGTVRAEVARRQADGTWLWAVDQPAIVK